MEVRRGDLHAASPSAAAHAAMALALQHQQPSPAARPTLPSPNEAATSDPELPTNKDGAATAWPPPSSAAARAFPSAASDSGKAGEGKGEGWRRG
jgi:hypothetical protein